MGKTWKGRCSSKDFDETLKGSHWGPLTTGSCKSTWALKGLCWLMLWGDWYTKEQDEEKVKRKLRRVPSSDYIS